MTKVQSNLTVNPRIPEQVYFCSSENPFEIVRVDTGKERLTSEPLQFKKRYKKVENLQVDPTGHFFTFTTESGFVVASVDDLSEIASIPSVRDGFVDEEGKIRVVDSKGYLVVYSANFEQLVDEMDRRRLTRISQGLSPDLFELGLGGSKPQIKEVRARLLAPLKENVTEKFDKAYGEGFGELTSLEEAAGVRGVFAKVRQTLVAQDPTLSSQDLDFILDQLQKKLSEKEMELATPIVARRVTDLEERLAQKNLTLTDLERFQDSLAELIALEGYVDQEMRGRIHDAERELADQRDTLFMASHEFLEQELSTIVDGAKVALMDLGSVNELQKWEDEVFPYLLKRLNFYLGNLPVVALELREQVNSAHRKLYESLIQTQKRMSERYHEVRAREVEVTNGSVALAESSINMFVERLARRGLRTPGQVDQFLENDELYKELETELNNLESVDPEAVRKLRTSLKFHLAQLKEDITRTGGVIEKGTGRRMVPLGNVNFPISERRTEEKVQKQEIVDLIFIPIGETPIQMSDGSLVMFGDLGIGLSRAGNEPHKRRLFQGRLDENDWRFGAMTHYKGVRVPGTVMTAEQYGAVKGDYADWSRGEQSEIRKEYKERRRALREFYETRKKVGQRDESDTEWQKEYSQLYAEFAQFCAERHVFLLEKIERMMTIVEEDIKEDPKVLEGGMIPRMDPFWVEDEETQRLLGEMAEFALMQLARGEGMLMLEGHTGTGKDILVKMFCAKTRRSLFSFDCSKWTREVDLTEDVMLVAKDGTTESITIPSIIVRGIQTPDAVVYLNEFNAMPEQAQIFLHTLTDEKRTITLKISGKTVRMADGVILMGSMNPEYRGTYTPQEATRRRHAPIRVEYPPLYRPRKLDAEGRDTDPNPNPQISSAEAIRMGRSMESLLDFTLQGQPPNTLFEQIWDSYVNGIPREGLPELTQNQRFDLDAILAVVEFSDKLRQAFLLSSAKSTARRGKLVVSQPIVGTDLGRIAWLLGSRMTPEEKAKADPESVARKLIEKIFVNRIYDAEEREKVINAMATWTSQKRPSAH